MRFSTAILAQLALAIASVNAAATGGAGSLEARQLPPLPFPQCAADGTCPSGQVCVPLAILQGLGIPLPPLPINVSFIFRASEHCSHVRALTCNVYVLALRPLVPARSARSARRVSDSPHWSSPSNYYVRSRGREDGKMTSIRNRRNSHICSNVWYSRSVGGRLESRNVNEWKTLKGPSASST